MEVGVAVMGASWPVLSGRTNSALLQRPAGPEGEVCVCVRVYVCVCVCVCCEIACVCTCVLRGATT